MFSQNFNVSLYVDMKKDQKNIYVQCLIKLNVDQMGHRNTIIMSVL